MATGILRQYLAQNAVNPNRDPFGEGVQVGSQLRRNRLDDEDRTLRSLIGGRLSEGDLAGAKVAALQGGDIGTGLDIGGRMDEQHKALTERFATFAGNILGLPEDQQEPAYKASIGSFEREAQRLGIGFDAGPMDRDALRGIAAQFGKLPKPASGDKGFTLGPGGRRYDAEGNLIASAPAAPPRERAQVPGRDVPYSPEVLAQIKEIAQGRRPAQAQFRTVKDPQTGVEYQENTATGERKAAPAPKLSPGQAAVDREAGKDLANFVAGGGFADVQKNIAQLDRAIGELEKGGVTGTTVGLTPDFILSATNQRAVDTQEAVSEVAQRNLRLILGAQFTQKEGDKLIARAYNPFLDEKINARRVKALKQSIIAAAKAKQEAWDYLQEHGTLAGFQGKLWSMADFERAVDEAGRSGNVSRETKGERRFTIKRKVK